MQRIWVSSIACALWLFCVGAVSAQQSEGAPQTLVEVVASGKAHEGDPLIGLIVDGQVVGTAPVTGQHDKGEWESLTFSLPASINLKAIGVVFMNGGETKPNGRELYVKYVTLNNGPQLYPEQGVFQATAEQYSNVGVESLPQRGVLAWDVEAAIKPKTEAVTVDAVANAPMSEATDDSSIPGGASPSGSGSSSGGSGGSGGGGLSAMPTMQPGNASASGGGGGFSGGSSSSAGTVSTNSSSSSTSVSTSTPTSSSSGSVSTVVSCDPCIQVPTVPVGINLSGSEYSWESYPTEGHLDYLSSKGIKLIRLPIAWEKLQPVLNGPLDTNQIQKLKIFLGLLYSYGMLAVVDMHNGGGYHPNYAALSAGHNGILPSTAPVYKIGTTTVPVSAFKDLWIKLATVLKGQAGIAGYDIMNEPNTMPSAAVWPQAAQAAVDGIRSIDATTTIFVEGDHWANAKNWKTYNATLLVNDPANKIIYEAHQYFDDGSGTYTGSYDSYGNTAASGVTEVQPFIDWLKTNNVQGYIGEFGAPSDDPRWLTLVDNFLNVLKQNNIASTAWKYCYPDPTGANSWWPMAVDPTNLLRYADGSDKELWSVLTKYTLPSSTSGTVTSSGGTSGSGGSLTPIDGACGSANNVGSVLAPTVNLCSAGTAPTIATSGASWAWTCAGQNGGADVYCSAPVQVTYADSQAYVVGNYTGYLSPWGKGSLVAGTDYTESMTVTPATFPNGTTLTWNWPNTAPVSSGVYNFLAIDYGNYDNSTYQYITSRQVSSVTTLTETHNLSYSGTLSGFDVIDDLFLTPNAGDQRTHSFEIEVFLHTPAFASSYARSVAQIGTVTVSGITWNVSIDNSVHDILFFPTNSADVTTGTIDIKAMFNYLVAQHVITGQEWFNGIALGSETQKANGTLVINSFSVNYQ